LKTRISEATVMRTANSWRSRRRRRSAAPGDGFTSRGAVGAVDGGTTAGRRTAGVSLAASLSRKNRNIWPSLTGSDMGASEAPGSGVRLTLRQRVVNSTAAAARWSLFVHVSAPTVPAWYRGAMAAPTDKLILIVDDEPTIREVLVSYFEHEYVPRGYAVETATNGDEALAVVRRRRPVLVLLDIEMPGMGGVEALHGIHAIDPKIPVIMVTGNESSQIAGDVIKDGAFSYLPKPVKFQYLDHLVAAALRD